MLAPLVLPFQITFAAFAVLWCVGALTLQKPKRIAWLTLAAVLLFIPSCVGVMALVDLQRYGRFDYASASDIPDDGYIELPAPATDITLYRNGAGHWAKFTIDTPSLRSWIDERRSLRPDLNQHHDDDEWLSTASDRQRPDLLELNKQIFGNRFPDTGWTYGPSMLQVHVSRSDRGGGYTVWHVPSTGDSYISAGYW
ncbi:hypothetical protein [Crateriforma conspicua]|uniref:Uncharacterized protein n=1 Tax=Crateriforma conspicua TaxID=2527996 RepID=A0A5C5YCV1_9PLAN|nr:hypothetical protein [Crateriforma conspicua]QDV61143.1 hypothetical protein Mal65_02660 [Crateriforma conspicua]TWT72603.1 hypothetical protein Pan14r_49230 [Crateriforma conspicua]